MNYPLIKLVFISWGCEAEYEHRTAARGSAEYEQLDSGRSCNGRGTEGRLKANGGDALPKNIRVHHHFNTRPATDIFDLMISFSTPTW